jgi:hypothetical protein
MSFLVDLYVYIFNFLKGGRVWSSNWEDVTLILYQAYLSTLDSLVILVQNFLDFMVLLLHNLDSFQLMEISTNFSSPYPLYSKPLDQSTIQY